jgi:hypothetical protein
MKIYRAIHIFVLIADAKDTGDKLFTGVYDTSDNISMLSLLLDIIIARFVGASDQALSQIFIDSMSPMNTVIHRRS